MTAKQLVTGLHTLQSHYGAGVAISNLPLGVLESEAKRGEMPVGLRPGAAAFPSSNRKGAGRNRVQDAPSAASTEGNAEASSSSAGGSSAANTDPPLPSPVLVSEHVSGTTFPCYAEDAE
jgi:hypothetical protein